MTAVNHLPKHIAKGRGWSFGALMLMFQYTGHEGQGKWKEAILYALLARTGCSFLPVCLPKIKEPKFYLDIYGSHPLLQLRSPGLETDPFLLHAQPLPTVYTILSAQGIDISTAEPGGFGFMYICVFLSVAAFHLVKLELLHSPLCLLWVFQGCPSQPCPAAR